MGRDGRCGARGIVASRRHRRSDRVRGRTAAPFVGLARGGGRGRREIGASRTRLARVHRLQLGRSRRASHLDLARGMDGTRRHSGDGRPRVPLHVVGRLGLRSLVRGPGSWRDPPERRLRPPANERPALESHGVVSLSEFPVFVGGEWWGVIGFDDCEGVREWSSDELSALRASATVLGAAVQRRRLDEVVMDTEVRSRQLIEHIPAVVYIESPEGRPRTLLHQPAGGGHLRLRPRRVALDARLLARPRPPRRSSTGRAGRRAQRTQNGRPSPSNTDSSLPTGSGGGSTTRRRSSTVPAARASGRGSSSISRSANVWRNNSVDAEEKFRTIVEQTEAIFYTQAIDPDDPTASCTTYVGAGQHGAHRLHRRGDRRGPADVATHHPPGRPRSGPRRGRRQQRGRRANGSPWSTG